ncbi:MAG: hypothetical protein H0X69_05755 [Gemmatimonadales bacterium]|nr:hypothetical protein [Gemmatimonadales bacterium]
MPAIMAGAAIALAHGTIALDGAATGGWVRAQSWAYTGSAEGASAMLETIAGSAGRSGRLQDTGHGPASSGGSGCRTISWRSWRTRARSAEQS